MTVSKLKRLIPLPHEKEPDWGRIIIQAYQRGYTRVALSNWINCAPDTLGNMAKGYSYPNYRQGKALLRLWEIVK